MPRWYWGLIGAIFYVEMLVLVSLKIHLPVPPDPVFKKPVPANEYHWTKGPYDDDWDFCWVDDNGQGHCWEEQI